MGPQVILGLSSDPLLLLALRYRIVFAQHFMEWMVRIVKKHSTLFAVLVSLLLVAGCSSNGISNMPPKSQAETGVMAEYLIGPGDRLNIFVWRHPEVSIEVPVRPDGRISSPLVEDLVAVGKTPTQLARDIEKILSVYIKQPRVTVIISGFGLASTQQIRVVGEVAQPQSLQYRENITLLDIMIAVGGLTDFAAGNSASIIRTVDGKQQQFRVRLTDLLKDGDIGANVEMMPGDIIIVPEAWF